jgi:hypothetical protein
MVGPQLPKQRASTSFAYLRLGRLTPHWNAERSLILKFLPSQTLFEHPDAFTKVMRFWIALILKALFNKSPGPSGLAP